MHSIYHFFCHLAHRRAAFAGELAAFPFPQAMLVCQNKGIFPDLVLRLNTERTLFTGGELIELKESQSCNIASFNSTVPTGEKAIRDLLDSNPSINGAMHNLGESPEDVPIRQVFYLIKGVCKGSLRVCLVHGRYFETISVTQLIKEAFRKVIADMADPEQGRFELPESLAFRQIDFSQTRHIEGAAVSLRFRIMTQAEPAANILKQLTGHRLSFIVPSPDEAADAAHDHKLSLADATLFALLRSEPHTHLIDGSRYRLYSF
jgi:hypothetical protein